MSSTATTDNLLNLAWEVEVVDPADLPDVFARIRNAAWVDTHAASHDSDAWSDIWQAVEVVSLLDGADPDLTSDAEATMRGIDHLTAD